MARTNKNSNRPKQLSTRIQNLIAGFSKLAPTEQFDVLGTLALPPGLVTQLQGLLLPIVNAEQAELAAKLARETRNASNLSTVQQVEAIEGAVKQHFGSKSPTLVTFGLEPEKARTQPSADARAESVAKANRTRAARAAALKATATPPSPPSPPAK